MKWSFQGPSQGTETHTCIRRITLHNKLGLVNTNKHVKGCKQIRPTVEADLDLTLMDPIGPRTDSDLIKNRYTPALHVLICSVCSIIISTRYLHILYDIHYLLCVFYNNINKILTYFIYKILTSIWVWTKLNQQRQNKGPHPDFFGKGPLIKRAIRGPLTSLGMNFLTCFQKGSIAASPSNMDLL